MKKHILYLVSCFVSFSLMVNNVWADLSVQAKSAIEQGKYAQAIPMLQQLSSSGDAVASYNLAMIYQKGLGVNRDGERAKSYMVRAAQRGLVDGYTHLSSKSVRPAIKPVSNINTLNTIALNITPQDWVMTQNPGHYTLQLASSTNAELIKKYFEENGLAQKAGYYMDVREGENWYALVYGSFSSVKEANDAIANLPPDLKKWSPWVRKLKNVQQIIRRNQG